MQHKCIHIIDFFSVILPVVVLEAVNFPDFSLSKSLLSNLLFACFAGETGRMVRSLECTDYLICDSLPTSPAKLQTSLKYKGVG